MAHAKHTKRERVCAGLVKAVKKNKRIKKANKTPSKLKAIKDKCMRNYHGAKRKARRGRKGKRR